MNLDFIFDVGQTLSLLFVIIFIEGVISGRPKGKWPGFLFACGMALITVIVGLVSKNFSYVLIMMVPTGLCFLVYFVSRRNVALGKGYRPEEEDL